ncbi:ATPase family AAA domain-containing protein 2B [Porphyridium purpureum]|uniref:ATPase family AAA domain-containing protein 2B n=1 Tax=Porphyridium purpureum TaxID=35688 RepID=A0A5J4Z5E5_PORPP|nr:ATPase family AAA domain-containing protein 2B [Porphyridium purpureum]|eukprot:POR3939..scf295_1
MEERRRTRRASAVVVETYQEVSSSDVDAGVLRRRPRGVTRQQLKNDGSGAAQSTECVRGVRDGAHRRSRRALRGADVQSKREPLLPIADQVDDDDEDFLMIPMPKRAKTQAEGVHHDPSRHTGRAGNTVSAKQEEGVLRQPARHCAVHASPSVSRNRAPKRSSRASGVQVDFGESDGDDHYESEEEEDESEVRGNLESGSDEDGAFVPNSRGADRRRQRPKRPSRSFLDGKDGDDDDECDNDDDDDNDVGEMQENISLQEELRAIQADQARERKRERSKKGKKQKKRKSSSTTNKDFLADGMSSGSDAPEGLEERRLRGELKPDYLKYVPQRHEPGVGLSHRQAAGTVRGKSKPHHRLSQQRMKSSGSDSSTSSDTGGEAHGDVNSVQLGKAYARARERIIRTGADLLGLNGTGADGSPNETLSENRENETGADRAVTGDARDGRGPNCSRRRMIEPVSVENLDWNDIGGLHEHIQLLKEMVFLPLLYPELVAQLGVQPPRGVLFYGPPGTGKTLTARALAAACNTSAAAGKKVSFFVRNGADCLSKWVGEAERNLRMMFEEAQRQQPAIIFFDEIDGLAPVRSSRQDQIHASIVSTLLGLMDGLHARGSVVVVGATNRLDAIDPALRRPGRFDRELAFTLPSRRARREILSIHTRSWGRRDNSSSCADGQRVQQLDPKLLDWIATKTVGYAGADLKALCSEATWCAVRREFPQIYQTNHKLNLALLTVPKLDAQVGTEPTAHVPPRQLEEGISFSLQVGAVDFSAALKAITPSSFRSNQPVSHPLPEHMVCLFRDTLREIWCALKGGGFTHVLMDLSRLEREHFAAQVDVDDICAPGSGAEADSETAPLSPREVASSSLFRSADHLLFDSREHPHEGDARWLRDVEMDEGRFDTQCSATKLVLRGAENGGQARVAMHVLHALEQCMVHDLSINQLLADPNARSPEEALVARFREAQQHTPSILYLPDAGTWWGMAGAGLQALLLWSMSNLQKGLPVLVLATATDLDEQLALQFDRCVWLKRPTDLDRKQLGALFSDLFDSSQRIAMAREPFRMKIARAHKQRLARLARLELERAKEREQAAHGEEKKREDHGPVPVSHPNAEVERAEEIHLRRLRMEIRAFLERQMKDKRFAIFAEPVDPNEAVDYYEIIEHPIDLSMIAQANDNRKYQCVMQMMQHIELLVQNAFTYNPPHTAIGGSILHRAHALLDVAHDFADSLSPALVSECNRIYARRAAIAQQTELAPQEASHAFEKTEMQQLRKRGENESIDDGKRRSDPDEEGRFFLGGCRSDTIWADSVKERILDVHEEGASGADRGQVEKHAGRDGSLKLQLKAPARLPGDNAVQVASHVVDSAGESPGHVIRHEGDAQYDAFIAMDAVQQARMLRDSFLAWRSQWKTLTGEELGRLRDQVVERIYAASIPMEQCIALHERMCRVVQKHQGNLDRAAVAQFVTQLALELTE